MPTSHPRVQVTVDPHLRSALNRSAASLTAATQAGRIRELALRGADPFEDVDSERYHAAMEELEAMDLSGLLEVVARRHADTPE